MSIRRMTEASDAEITTLAAVLAEAFADYAWTNWTVDSDRREARIAAIHRLYLKHVALPQGEIWTDGDLAGVAVLLPPDAAELPQELVDKLSALHGEAGRRLQTELPQQPDGTWTLATIGVAPSKQGTGLGTALMEALLHNADAHSRPVGLETSAESNLEFYRRLGFVVWVVSEMPSGGQLVWSMLRNPR